MLKGVIEKARKWRRCITTDRTRSRCSLRSFFFLCFYSVPPPICSFSFIGACSCVRTWWWARIIREGRRHTHKKKRNRGSMATEERKKDRRSILSSSFYFSSERCSALTKKAEWLCYFLINYSKWQQDVNRSLPSFEDTARYVCVWFEFWPFFFCFWKGRKKWGRLFFSVGYSWENEIKMCWWWDIGWRGGGVYCLAKQHPLWLWIFWSFSSAVTVVVVYTNDYCARRRGGRQAVVIISTLHFF